MKAKNKFERNIDALRIKLPEIGKEHYDYGFSRFFKARGVISRKTISCLECGHSEKSELTSNWQEEVAGHTCSNCKKTLEVRQHSLKNYTDAAYMGILNTVGEFQVLRIIYYEKFMVRKLECNYTCSEVVQHWIHESGKRVILAKKVNFSYQYMDNWVISDELSFKGFHRRYFLDLDCLYPKKKILPILKRNGYKSNNHRVHPVKLFEMLLTNPMAETLIKAKQYSLLKKLDYMDLNKYWGVMKICIRKNYIVKKADDWVDYINLLSYFGKDLNNPKYVCPEDLDKEHGRYVEKKRVRQMKEDLEKRKEKIKEQNKLYVKQKKLFFSLLISEGPIVIKPLKSVKDFLNQGDYFNHCIYTNQYYEKQNSLLLSASVDNLLTETIEVDLREFKVLQARGKGNKQSEHHKEIITLLNKNMHQIQKIASIKIK